MRRARRPFFRPDPENAVVAAGHFNPLERDRPDDLRKGQGQHGKIDAGQLNGKEAEDGRAETSQHWTEHEAGQHRQTCHLGEQRDTVGTEPEIGRMTKRGEPADRHQEMQARGKQREDRDLRTNGQRIAAADQRQRRRQRQRHDRGETFVRRQRAPWVDGEPRRTARSRFRLAEQAPGPHDQNHGHHQKYQDDGDLGKDEDAERVQFGHQHRRDERADDAAEAADHHHHEHIDDDAQVHGVVDRIARDLQRAAERREEDTQGEYAGEQPFLIDAEGRHHVPILGRGPHQHAPARPLEQQPHGAQHHGAEHDQEEIIGRNILAQEINGPRKARRAAAEKIARAPDQHHQILNHQGQAERCQ